MVKRTQMQLRDLARSCTCVRWHGATALPLLFARASKTLMVHLWRHAIAIRSMTRSKTSSAVVSCKKPLGLWFLELLLVIELVSKTGKGV
jgi:hypothetical protein